MASFSSVDAGYTKVAKFPRRSRGRLVQVRRLTGLLAACHTSDPTSPGFLSKVSKVTARNRVLFYEKELGPDGRLQLALHDARAQHVTKVSCVCRASHTDSESSHTWSTQTENPILQDTPMTTTL